MAFPLGTGDRLRWMRYFQKLEYDYLITAIAELLQGEALYICHFSFPISHCEIRNSNFAKVAQKSADLNKRSVFLYHFAEKMKNPHLVFGRGVYLHADNFMLKYSCKQKSFQHPN